MPYQPPEEYDFIVKFSQQRLRNGISLIMPNPKKGGSFYWCVGSGDGASHTLSVDPITTRQLPEAVAAKNEYTAVVQVRRTYVKCLLNGKEVVQHKTNFSDLTSDDWRKLKDATVLAVACDDPAVFHQVRVIEISGKGKRTRPGK